MTEKYPMIDSPMNRAMRSGHFNRTGHEMVAHLEPTDEPGIMKRVYDCCIERNLA